MKLRVVWWIPVAGAFLAHATGVLDTASQILGGIDKSLNAVVDLRKVVPQVGAILHPAPPAAKPKTVQIMPRKAPTQ